MPNRRFHESLTDSEQAMLEDLLRSQPLLRLQSVDERAYIIRGSLGLYDSVGVTQAAYAIEMQVPRSFPKSPPVIRETGGLIPRILDRHINQKDATCCIQLPVEFHQKRPSTIREYVDGPVSSFFLAQLYFDHFKKWPNGERGHGRQGLAEYCQEQLGTDDLALVAKMVKLIQEWRAHPKNERCPCGSHRKISKCHEKLFDDIKKWPTDVRNGFLETLDAVIKALLKS